MKHFRLSWGTKHILPLSVNANSCACPSHFSFTDLSNVVMSPPLPPKALACQQNTKTGSQARPDQASFCASSISKICKLPPCSKCRTKHCHFPCNICTSGLNCLHIQCITQSCTHAMLSMLPTSLSSHVFIDNTHLHKCIECKEIKNQIHNIYVKFRIVWLCIDVTYPCFDCDFVFSKVL